MLMLLAEDRTASSSPQTNGASRNGAHTNGIYINGAAPGPHLRLVTTPEEESPDVGCNVPSMVEYAEYLRVLERRVREACQDTLVMVGNLSLGDGTGMPVISVQGECMEHMRGVFAREAVIVQSLSQGMYDHLHGK